MIEDESLPPVPAAVASRALEVLDTAVLVVDGEGIVMGAVGGLGARHPMPFRGEPIGPWVERLGTGAGNPDLADDLQERGGAEYVLVGPDGLRRQFLAEALALVDRWHVPGADGWWMLVVRDVTQQRDAERQVEHSRRHDALTGLPNRQYLADLVEAALERRRAGQLVGLAVFDLDRFAAVVASVGAGNGDLVLRQVAERIVTESSGHVVARLDGDAYAVLLDDVADAEEAVRIADAVRASLHDPVDVGGGKAAVSASAGVAVSLSPQAAAADLLRDAESALATAKRRGRNRTELFDDALRAAAAGHLLGERTLRRAIAEHGLRAYFQPITDAATGRMVGAEALVRIVDPERGLVPPSEFIPLAEETGLIVDLDLWMLDECCRWARTWMDRFHSRAPYVSCNVSPALIARGDLAEVVRAARRDHGLPSYLLALEMTETTLIEASPAMWEMLAKIRASGVHIGLDDFGTGFSSLTYLRDFPVSFLKIDQSFVRGIGTRKGDHEIVESVVRMSHALGLKVVAEGVEQAHQHKALVELGCHRLQGYLISRPVPPDAITQRLEDEAVDVAAVGVAST